MNKAPQKRRRKTVDKQAELERQQRLQAALRENLRRRKSTNP